MHIAIVTTCYYNIRGSAEVAAWQSAVSLAIAPPRPLEFLGMAEWALDIALRDGILAQQMPPIYDQAVD